MAAHNERGYNGFRWGVHRECDQHPQHYDGLIGFRGIVDHPTWFDRSAVGSATLDNEMALSTPLALTQWHLGWKMSRQVTAFQDLGRAYMLGASQSCGRKLRWESQVCSCQALVV